MHCLHVLNKQLVFQRVLHQVYLYSSLDEKTPFQRVQKPWFGSIYVADSLGG